MKIKPNIYRAESNYKEIKTRLEDEDYRYMGMIEEKDYGLKFYYFLQTRNRNGPDWISETQHFFGCHQELREQGEKVNGVMLCQTKSNLYLISLGHAFHVVETLCDRNFGMDIAERVVNNEGLKLISRSKTGSNINRSVNDYILGLIELPNANESYDNIVGVPKDNLVEFYGRIITFGKSISLSRDYAINSTDEKKLLTNKKAFFNLFNQLDITLNSSPINKFPRLVAISKDDEINEKLFEELLKCIIKEGNNHEFDVQINLNLLQYINDSPTVLSNKYKIYIYINGQYKDRVDTEIDTFTILEFIESNKSTIQNIDDIKFKFESEDQTLDNYIRSFGQVMNCQITFNGNTYLLVDNRWSLPNERYQELLNDKLKEITGSIDYPEELNVSYQPKEQFAEDQYITSICEKEYIQLHKKTIFIMGVPVELADFYDPIRNKLYAVKMGNSAQNSIYSLQQSMAGITIQNRLESEEIINLLKQKDLTLNGKIISGSTIKDIVNCRDYNVLWVIKQGPGLKYQRLGGYIQNKNVELHKFSSLLQKLAICNWYEFMLSNRYLPKISFALAKPNDN